MSYPGVVSRTGHLDHMWLSKAFQAVEIRGCDSYWRRVLVYVQVFICMVTMRLLCVIILLYSIVECSLIMMIIYRVSVF